jgi:hypothetical protein
MHLDERRCDRLLNCKAVEVDEEDDDARPYGHRRRAAQRVRARSRAVFGGNSTRTPGRRQLREAETGGEEHARVEYGDDPALLGERIEEKCAHRKIGRLRHCGSQRRAEDEAEAGERRQLRREAGALLRRSEDGEAGLLNRLLAAGAHTLQKPRQ